MWPLERGGGREWEDGIAFLCLRAGCHGTIM